MGDGHFVAYGGGAPDGGQADLDIRVVNFLDQEIENLLVLSSPRTVIFPSRFSEADTFVVTFSVVFI
jgi:hypothetical protein